MADHTPEAVEAVARAVMLSRSPELLGADPGCNVLDWASEGKDNAHVAQALAQARAALSALDAAGYAVEKVGGRAERMEEAERSLYETLKLYRDVPDDRSGVAAGILTPRETWLYDEVRKILRRAMVSASQAEGASNG